MTGVFFQGTEADSWLRTGFRLLSKELPEQILQDGGHYELSPMYHALVLEDLLDLLNLAQVYPGHLSAWAQLIRRWRTDVVPRMLDWLSTLCHPDGEIALFNDSALGVAPSLEALGQYAHRLGIPSPQRPRGGLTLLPDSGYIRYQNEEVVVLLDVACLGPDFLPGHGHADTLTFEMSLYDHRLLVDTGVSTYEAGRERLRDRGTSAHNTVLVDGFDSSEVWGSFRVARRAKPFGLEIHESNGRARVVCSHTGYHRLKGRVTHLRDWQFSRGSLSIADLLKGRFANAKVHFHVHPDWSVRQRDGGNQELRHPEGLLCLSVVDGQNLTVEAARYHPSFGQSLSNCRLMVEIPRENPSLTTRFNWTPL